MSAPPLSRRHSSLYFPDGTLTLKAHDGTLYNVNRQLLVLKSELFAGMLTLPQPPPEALSPTLSQGSRGLIERAAQAGLDGTTDETAVALPETLSAEECEIFLEFVFNTLPWSQNPPPLERLCALLKTCDFFAVESGIRYAVHYLENHVDLGSARRYRLARDYNIRHWAKMAFEELMVQSVLTLEEEDEQDLGWNAYRVLVRTQAEVMQHKLCLAFFPVQPVHAPDCYSNEYCGRSWEENWVAASGPLGSLLRDQLSGKELHDKLHDLSIPGMEPECRRRTVRIMQETPTEKSLLKAEEKYIEDAVQELIRQW
ncbi:hypothetical protein DFH08DRAFT_1077839 [Mycena albidolilacea]|uniref:BTB domain-containing protein n=1 Tax=Mycena albidolilacea TaxID=1033008 RepID=A0AAD7A8I6_9AGAR|nr:hypothetical protein DFH08DRAFT_1077839 [Mycena albidolilacea]